MARATRRQRGAVALATTARIAPIDGGFAIQTASGTDVITCGLSLDEATQILDALRRPTTPRRLATALGWPASTLSPLLRELTAAGLLVAVGARAPRGRAGGVAGEVTGEVIVAGTGELAAAMVERLLASSVRVAWLGGRRARARAITDRALPAAARRAALVVCCVDRPGRFLEQMSVLARAHHLPCLPVQATADGYQIGPIDHVPGGPELAGCASCAELFRQASDPFAHAVARDVLRRDLAGVAWCYEPSPTGRAAAAALAVACIAAWRARGATELVGHALVVDRLGANPRTGPVVAHPACVRGSPQSGPPTDLPGAAETVAARLATDEQPLELLALFERVRGVAAPHGIGPVYPTRLLSADQRRRLHAFVRERGVAPGASVIANAHEAKTYLPQLHDTAVGIDFASAEVAQTLSVVEALERLSVFAPPLPIPTERRAFAEVADRALDPASLPLYAEQQYADPEFVPRRFDPRVPIDWVWGIDVATGEPIRVPADVVRPGRPGELIVHCTSSGAACHTSFVHAVLSGLYELIERDAFSILWMSQLAMPRVAQAVDPRGVGAELAALGLELELVDATTDLEIPVLLVACRDRRDPDLFVTTLAAGRSTAVIVNRLQREVFQIAMHAVLGRPQTSGAVAEHFAAYQHRDRNRLAAFMTASTATSDFAAHPHFAASPDESTRDELARLVAGLHRHGHRVFAVDLTSSWLRALGLYAVRVVVPGLQPIHFGRGNRVLGGRRLYEAPRRMGYRTRDLAIDELNPAEHPF